MNYDDFQQVLAAVASGTYSQEEVFTQSRQVYDDDNLMTFIPAFWEAAINSGVLNAEGLFKVAMDKSYRNWFPYAWTGIRDVAILAISKKLMTSEQLMEICKLHKMSEVTSAAIATGSFSDDQVRLLEELV